MTRSILAICSAEINTYRSHVFRHMAVLLKYVFTLEISCCVRYCLIALNLFDFFLIFLYGSIGFSNFF